MAPLITVQTLYQTSLNAVTSSLKTAFKRLDVEKKGSNKRQLQRYFNCLPLPIQENLTKMLLDDGEDDDTIFRIYNKDFSKTIALTLQIIPNERTQTLKVNQQSYLKPYYKKDVVCSVKKILQKGENLRHVSLTGICDDKVMKLIGENCRNLTQLNIQYLYKASDKGIHYIIPSSEDICAKFKCKSMNHGCPELVSLTIKEDWISEQTKIDMMSHLKCLKLFSFDISSDVDLRKVSQNPELVALIK